MAPHCKLEFVCLRIAYDQHELVLDTYDENYSNHGVMQLLTFAEVIF